MSPYPLIDNLLDDGVLDNNEHISLAKMKGKVDVMVVNRHLLGIVEGKSADKRQLFARLLVRTQPEFAALSVGKSPAIFTDIIF